MAITTTFLAAHALPPEFAGDRDGYIDLVCDEMIPARGRAGLADAVDAFCEASASRRPRSRRVFEAARRTACRSSCTPTALQHRRRGAGRRIRRPLGRPSRASGRSRRRGHGARRRPSPSCCPGAFYFVRETQDAAGRSCCAGTACRSPWRPIAIPGTSPLTSPAADHEHGRDPVPPDGRGVPCRRHPRGGARRSGSASRDRHARGRQVVRPGDLGHRAAGRAGLRHRLQPARMPGSGGANDAVVLRPGEVEPRASGARSIAAPQSTLDPPRRAARSRRAPRRSSGSSARASRSTASTPALASWPACAIAAGDLARLQRNIVLSHAAGVGEPMPVAIVRLMMALKLASLAQGASGVAPEHGRHARGDARARA